MINFFCNLQDAVDCPEWVVPFHLFKFLAEEVLSCSLPSTVTKCCLCLNRQMLLATTHCFLCQYDLELVLMKNFHEFVHEYLQKPEFTELIWRLGALGDGRQDQSNFAPNLGDWLPSNAVSFSPSYNSKT